MVLDPNTTIDDAGDASYTPEYQDQQDQYERQQAGLTPAPAALQQTAPGVYSPTATAAPLTGITPRPRPPRFNPMDYEVDKDAPGLQFRPETVEQHPGWWHDMGQAIWQGTLSQGKDVVDAAQFAAQQMGADPTIRQHIKDASGVVNDEIKSSIASMDPKRQAALSASWMSMFNGNNVDANGVKIPSPGEVGYFNYFSTNIAQLVPTVLTAILPASLVGKMGIKALSMLGMATKATDAVTGAVTATRAATVARTALQAGTTGSIFGTEGTGQMFDYVQQQLANMKPEQKMNSPIYAEIIKQGGTDADGSEAMLRASAPYIYGYGALSGIAGVGVGGIVAGKLGAAGLGRVASAALGGAEGAVTMGAQGAGEAATQQAIQNQQGQRQGYDFNAILANAFSQGTPGLVLGAGFGALHGRHAEPAKPPPQGDTDPANVAALAAADIYGTPAGPPEIAGPPAPPQGQLDLGSAPPGPPAGSPQGEMFPTVQEANRPTNTVGTGLTEAPTPTPPPGPADQQAGMVGAKQGELPINQTPPTMVAATGQGEMFPSLPEANPPVAQVTPFRGDEPPPPPPGAPPPGGGGGAPAATQAAVKTSQAKTPPPAGQRPSGTMKKAELNDALIGMGIDTKGMNRDDMARRFDREQARAPSTLTPDVSTVVKSGETAPAGETAPGPDAATPPAPPTQGALTPPVSEGVRFTTGKGSTYQVHDDGTTTRDKAARPEHPGEQGPQPRSERTVYVTPEEATRLGGDFQTQGGAAKEIAEHSSGALGVRYTEGKDAGKFEQRTLVKHTTEPEVGKVPVELWDGGKRAHFGNKITEVAKGEPTAKISTGVRPEGGPASVTDERPTQATAEVTPEVKPKEDPREIAVGHLAAAKQRVLAEAIANGQPVRRGSPAEKAINAAMEEMQRAFSDPKQDPGDVMKMLHTDARRGTPNEGETIAAYAARRALVSGMLKEITGNEKFKLPPLKLKEVADTRSEVEQDISEAQQQVVAKPRKLSTSEAVDESATGAGEGGETAGLTAVDEKLPKGTSIVVRAKKLVQQILDPQHPMDVPTAEKILAKTSNLGRPRTKGFGDLHDAFETEWKRITGEAGQKIKAKLEAQLAKLDRQQPLTKEGTQARVLEEEMHDRKVADIQKKLEEYAPERLIAMAKAMKEIADPIKDAADKRQALVARAAEIKGETPDIPLDAPLNEGINPRSSRYVTGSADRRLGANYEAAFGDRIRGTRGGEAPLMAREAAAMIAQDPMISAEQGPLREVAERFARLLPADVPIMSLERAMREGRIKQGLFNDLRSRNVYGAYDPESRTILHNIDGPRVTGSHVETTLHEMSHAISYHYLNALERADKFHPDLRVLNAIRGELREHVLRESAAGNLTEAETQRLIKAFGNNHELHTQMFTDPVVQGFASARKASQGLLDTLRSLGHPGSPGQSVWRSFANWVRKATGQGPAKSASEFTLFDHIIKPVTDIQDRAAEYNKQNILPKDPMLRAAGGPVYDGITNTFSAATRNLVDRMDLSNVSDRIRVAAMRARTRDALVDNYKDVTPSIVAHRAAEEKIAAESSRYADKYGDRGDALIKRLTRADDRDALWPLMTNVGIHDVHVGDNLPKDANDHLTTPEQQARAREDQAVYDKLSAKDKAIYNDTKQLNKEMYDTRNAASRTSLLNGYKPDATPEERAAFTSDVKSPKTLEKFLADPDHSETARAFGDNWATSRTIMTGMARILNTGFVKGDYFPLDRFGEWVVRAGKQDDLENYTVSRFESRAKAEEFRAELARNRDDVHQVAKMDTSRLGDYAPRPAFVDAMESELKRKGFSPEEIEKISDMTNAMLMRGASQSAVARARMMRRGVKGASIDQPRIMAAHLLSEASQHGTLLHGLERDRALIAMHDEAKAWEQPGGDSNKGIQAMSAYNEVVKRQVKPGEHDSLIKKLGAFANSMSFSQALMSPSLAIMHSAETFANAVSHIGGKHGFARTNMELLRALKDASPVLARGGVNTYKAMFNQLKGSDWKMANVLLDRIGANSKDPELYRMAKLALEQSGIVDHTIMSDVANAMNPKGAVGSGARTVWNAFYNTSAMMLHSVDVMNRVAGFVTALRLEMRHNGGNREAAIEYAIQATRRIMPNYTAVNRERLSSGPIMSTLMQFKRYGVHMYNTAATLLYEMNHGDKESRWVAAKTMASLVTTHAMLAGVLTLIADPLRYFMGTYDLFSGKASTSGFHDYTNDARKGFDDLLGPVIGKNATEAIMMGLPHLLGMDWSKRTGIANMLEMPEMSGFNKKGMQDLLFGLATGATGENLSNMVDGAGKLMNGDVSGFLGVLPRVLRDAMKAAELASHGLIDSTGKTIAGPEKFGWGSIASQAIGIQPSSVTEQRAGRNAVLEAEQEQKANKTQLSNRWLNAAPQDRPAIWQQIMQFNRDPHNKGAAISRDTLMKDLENRRKQAKAPFGLRLPAKSAKTLAEAGSFANVQ